MADAKLDALGYPLPDFLLRLTFFASAPAAIVFIAALFPVRGALIDVLLALGVFALGEAQSRFLRFRWLNWLLSEAVAFEAYYRKHPPRAFLYYVFYPILFPYWLANPEARREFLVFRGYTLGGFAILVGTLVWQYFTLWKPELGLRQYLPSVLVTLTVEMWLALSLLMPIATTVVLYHTSKRRRQLLTILTVGIVSASLTLAYLQTRRDPVVSYATRERVIHRTRQSRGKAQKALLSAAWAARKQLILAAKLERSHIEGDGKVTGEPLERARDALGHFYKRDESFAFDVWASDRRHPKVVVVYFERGSNRPAIWLAVDERGRQIVDRARLPKRVFSAMRAAADGSEDLLTMWPSELSVDDLMKLF